MARPLQGSIGLKLASGLPGKTGSGPDPKTGQEVPGRPARRPGHRLGAKLVEVAAGVEGQWLSGPEASMLVGWLSDWLVDRAGDEQDGELVAPQRQSRDLYHHANAGLHPRLKPRFHPKPYSALPRALLFPPFPDPETGPRAKPGRAANRHPEIPLPAFA